MDARTRRAMLASTATAGVLALAGCLGGGSDGDDESEALDVPDGTELVRVGPDSDYVFDPEELTVDTGTPVRFVWLSSTHNVVPTSQPDAADWAGHETIEDRDFYFEHTFETPGRYEYVCTPHQNQGMQGAVVVEE